MGGGGQTTCHTAQLPQCLGLAHLLDLGLLLLRLLLCLLGQFLELLGGKLLSRKKRCPKNSLMNNCLQIIHNHIT